MHSSFKMTFAFMFTAIIGLMMSSSSMADDTVAGKAKETGRDMSRGAKKMGRDIKDKTCEMVNGKMECAAQRAKHGILNTTDKVEDAVE